MAGVMICLPRSLIPHYKEHTQEPLTNDEIQTPDTFSWKIMDTWQCHRLLSTYNSSGNLPYFVEVLLPMALFYHLQSPPHTTAIPSMKQLCKMQHKRHQTLHQKVRDFRSKSFN
jgi:hypothetical protein